MHSGGCILATPHAHVRAAGCGIETTYTQREFGYLQAPVHQGSVLTIDLASDIPNVFRMQDVARNDDYAAHEMQLRVAGFGRKTAIKCHDVTSAFLRDSSIAVSTSTEAYQDAQVLTLLTMQE